MKIEEYAKFNDEELANIFKNAVDIITNNKPRKEEAVAVLEFIKKEWARRKKLYLEGKIRVKFPEKGMLSTLGYVAGQMNMESRHYLLKHIVTSNDLPFVQSPVYMASWGEVLSGKRLAKLSYLLWNLINKKRYKTEDFYHRTETRENWKDDLEYLYQEYYKDKHNFRWPVVRKNKSKRAIS